jgi:hypothetical protein
MKIDYKCKSTYRNPILNQQWKPLRLNPTNLTYNVYLSSEVLHNNKKTTIIVKEMQDRCLFVRKVGFRSSTWNSC